MRMNEFEKWLIKEEKKGKPTASSYKSSIDEISQHYSQQTNESINLYNISDITFLDNLVKEYRAGGEYEDFGNKNHGTPKAAIAAYVRFIKNEPKRRTMKKDLALSNFNCQ